MFNWVRYRQWRDAVLKRDGGVCRICGREAETAHHLLFQAYYPHLRYDVSNGRAVCHSCHSQIHEEELPRKRPYIQPEEKRELGRVAVWRGYEWSSCPLLPKDVFCFRRDGGTITEIIAAPPLRL